MAIEVLGKPNCSMCDATKRFLNKYQIPYTYTDVSTDMAAFERAKATGLQQLPILFVEGQEPVSGFRVDVLQAERKRLAEAAEQQLAAA